MKYKTPCFVLVENKEERLALYNWCLDIGYHSVFLEIEIGVAEKLVCTDGFVEVADGNSDFSGLYDCGTNIELFKALAAMNDENDRAQFFVDDLGHWYKSHKVDEERMFWSYDEYGRLHYAHKATAAEIIDHFKK